MESGLYVTAGTKVALLDENNQRMDRLAAVMQAAKRFVSNRPNDRIGLVFFGLALRRFRSSLTA